MMMLVSLKRSELSFGQFTGLSDLWGFAEGVGSFFGLIDSGVFQAPVVVL